MLHKLLSPKIIVCNVSCPLTCLLPQDDVWAETRYVFRYSYFACMDGIIYNITEWATCQVYSHTLSQPVTSFLSYSNKLYHFHHFAVKIASLQQLNFYTFSKLFTSQETFIFFHIFWLYLIAFFSGLIFTVVLL